MSVQNSKTLILPDKIIVDTLNQVLTILRDDYAAVVADGREEEGLLYLMFGANVIGKYEMYKSAVRLFITKPTNPKHIDVKLSFDHNSQVTTPTIVVSLPSESTVNNSISIGEGDQEEIVIPRNSPEQDEYRMQYARNYLATYHVIIITENRDEMIVVYNVMKSMMTSCMNHFMLEGLLNIKLGGQDLGILPNIPDRGFRRAITMSFQYEQVVPSLVIQNIFRKIRLFWKPEGAVTAQGPIEISTDDDLTASSGS